MLKVGIISAWHVHADEYASAVRDSGKAQITAVWDFDEAMGREFAVRYGAEFVADYDAFLARTDVEAVVCNSPTTMHPELLTKAAAAGKAIFTEKLLSTDSASTLALCEAIEKSGVTFTISLPLRTEPQFLLAKQLVEQGALGRVSGARMRRSHGGVSDNWLPERWFDVNMTGGGAMMDLGAHPIYVLSFLFGAPLRVSGMTSNLFGTSADENAIALAEFEGGVLGTCETAFTTYGVPDILEVYGTEGALYIRGRETRLVTKALEKEGVKTSDPVLPAARLRPINQFIDACIDGTGTPEYLGPRDGVVMTRMIEACYNSDKENKTIIL